MFNQAAEMAFILSGLAVAILLLLRNRRLNQRDAGAAATAAFGLFLCGRYAALTHGGANWMFTVGVGFMMALLAYNSLGFSEEAQPAAE
jgi:hypothetical protein